MAAITGLITVNGKQILEVDAAPAAGAGTPAPIASLAMFDNGALGALYIKTGAADTAWSVVDVNEDWALTGNTLTGVGPTTPNEQFGSLNDYDVKFIRNNVEQMRLQSGALLVGLSASLGGRLQVNSTVAGADVMKEILNATANPVVNVTRMYRIQTTTAVAQTFDIAIPNDSNALIETRACVRQTGGVTGSAGDGASYVRTVHASNVAGTVSQLFNQTDFTYELLALILMDFTSAANGANIRYSCTGVANRNLSWGIRTELLITAT